MAKYVKTDGTRITHLKDKQPVTRAIEEYTDIYKRPVQATDDNGILQFENGVPVMTTEDIERTHEHWVETPIDGWTEAPDEVTILHTVNEDGTFSAPVQDI